MSGQITVAELQKALPPQFKANATQQLADALNNLPLDSVQNEGIRENFLTYANVLGDGKFKMMDYMNAIVFVTLKMLGKTSKDAYAIVFPNRHAELTAKGTSQKDYASYVSAYAKGKLVMAITEQALIPVWLSNAPVYQKAINVQAHLMENADSELVRTQAANSLLTHLAKPKEAVNNALKIELNDNSGMGELTALLRAAAQQQIATIQSGGATAGQLAGMKIVDVEAKNVAN